MKELIDILEKQRFILNELQETRDNIALELEDAENNIKDQQKGIALINEAISLMTRKKGL